MTPAPKKRRASGPSGPTTPHAKRTHRMIQVTLAPETRERLDAMQAADGGTRSALVASLIDDEWARRAVDRAGEERIAEVRARNKKP